MNNPGRLVNVNITIEMLMSKVGEKDTQARWILLYKHKGERKILNRKSIKISL
jgi:hypothetical protein